MPHFMIVLIPCINLLNLSWTIKCLFLRDMVPLSCWYSIELPQLVKAIQMSINICFYKEADKKYTSCNLKTMKLLDFALIRILR